MSARGESTLRVMIGTWSRRALSLPLYVGLTVVCVVTLPLLLLGAALVDCVRRRRWATARCTAFFVFYLVSEIVGVIASFLVWLASGVWAGAARGRYLRWNFRLQTWWGTTLYRGASLLFGLRTTVEGTSGYERGPIIVFIRHASVADAILPMLFLSVPSGLVLRYVLKRELLWDPCLDIVGRRLRNAFVHRGSGDSRAEIAAVLALMSDLDDHAGVLIYPEGTRFTSAKRERILAKLAQGSDRRLYERARKFRHVLPPRLGGPLGLLEHNQRADVVFMAHTGLEAAGSLWDALDGALVGGAVRVCLWRVPFAAIPTSREARVAWLYEHWQRVDDWIDAARSPCRARLSA